VDAYIKKLDAQKKRMEFKQALVEYMGGKCSFCWYSRCLSALEFHHIDVSRKEFNISSTTNLEKAKKELDGCILLCANCHREAHQGLIPSAVVDFDSPSAYD